MAYVQGVDSLINKLKQINIQSVNKGLEKSGLLVEGTAKELCPVDDGQLRQSINSKVIDNKNASIGTNVEYAPYVHQGTGIYAKNGDGRKTPWSYKDEKGEWHTTRGQQPNPFLERALDSNRDKIIKIFQEEIRRAVK